MKKITAWFDGPLTVKFIVMWFLITWFIVGINGTIFIMSSTLLIVLMKRERR